MGGLKIRGVFGRPGGDGVLFPVNPVSSFYAVAGRNKIELTWTDPGNLITTTGMVIAEWVGTKIVRNTERYPQSVSDGVLVLDSTVRNQHATTPYVDDGIENEVTYYYQAFTRTMDGVINWNEQGGASATPTSTQPLSNLPAGALVNFLVNNVSRNFIVVHQGRPSTLYDVSFDGGTILLMKDIYENRAWGTTYPYGASSIHPYLNSDFLNLIDAKIRAEIRQVKVPYLYSAAGGGVVNSGANGLQARIWLLGGYEVNWTNSVINSLPVDGATLSYFAGTATTDAKRTGYLSGSPAHWWLRSSFISGSSVVVVLVGGGNSSAPAGATYIYGVRPALVLPNNIEVSALPNQSGSYDFIL